MAKVIIRVAKIKSFGQLKEYQAHVNREKETPNANQNVKNVLLRGENNILATVDNFIKDRGIKITQGKNKSVLCTEMLLTASPEFFRNSDGTLNAEKTQKWVLENEKWLRETYGNNYLFGKVHLDETSPHISAIICATKYNKAYKREVLAHKAWFGKTVDKKKNIDINKLKDLQTTYAERMQSCGFNLERGKEKSKAKHKDIKDFYTDINKTKEKVEEIFEEKDTIIKKLHEKNKETVLETKVEIDARNSIIKKLAKEYNIEEHVAKAYPKAKEMAKEKIYGKSNTKVTQQDSPELEL